MTDYISQYHVDTSVTLAANGASGDTYTFNVPNSATDSIVSAWAVASTNTGYQGLQGGSGFPPIYGPTGFTTGSNGEITGVTFQTQGTQGKTWARIEVIYITPSP